MLKQLFARKPIALLQKEVKTQSRLKRVLGPVSLTALGIGCVIGAGIFVLTGIVAHDKTGPAIMLSFVVSGTACIFAALCYAEFAAMAPVSGSAYTYAYASLGELFAWIIGWDLILEYTVASATVAHGWSHYFQDLLGIFHIKLPHVLTNAPFDFVPATGSFAATGTWLDLPAILVTLMVTWIMVKGIRESANFNAVMVIIKLAVVFFVIGVGAFYINPANWQPFAPFGWGGLSFFGHNLFGQIGAGGQPLGMLAGAAMIFFAYIGFDAVSTQAEEARNPQRDVPIGIIASLLICTVLYIAVSAVLTGMVPSQNINVSAPLSNAFMQVGLPWAQLLISLGAVAGITSVLLVLMLGQPRILLAMARDGLLPKNFFSAIHKKFRTPWKSSILTGLLVASMAGFLPLRILAELVNIGTLLAFVIVCGAVLVMRYRHPEIKRPFKVPFFPAVPILGIIFCFLLMSSLPAENWMRLFAWLGIGLVIYFTYSRHHSVLKHATKKRSR